MIVADASVMMSALHPPDVHHQQSRDWLVQHLRAGDTLIAPMLLLSEISGSITRRSGNPALGRLALDRLIAFRQFRLVPLDARLGSLPHSLRCISGSVAPMPFTLHSLISCRSRS